MFRKGDIVELMSLNEYNGEEVKVGWRFRVDDSFSDLVKVSIPNRHYCNGEGLFHHCQVFLYKRSIINWIKYYAHSIR